MIWVYKYACIYIERERQTDRLANVARRGNPTSAMRLVQERGGARPAQRPL